MVVPSPPFGAAVSLSSLWAMLLLLFHLSLVWCCFHLLSGAAFSYFLLGVGAFPSPPFVWCCFLSLPFWAVRCWVMLLIHIWCGASFWVLLRSPLLLLGGVAFSTSLGRWCFFPLLLLLGGAAWRLKKPRNLANCFLFPKTQMEIFMWRLTKRQDTLKMFLFAGNRPVGQIGVELQEAPGNPNIYRSYWFSFEKTSLTTPTERSLGIIQIHFKLTF